MSLIYPNPPAAAAASSPVAFMAENGQFLLQPFTSEFSGGLEALGCNVAQLNAVLNTRSTATYFQSLKRLEWRNSAPANPALLMTKTIAGEGGVTYALVWPNASPTYEVNVVFGIPVLSAGTIKSNFVGLVNSDSTLDFLAAIDPSGFNGVFGFGIDSGLTDTAPWQLMQRDGVGATTLTNTGVVRAQNVVYKARFSAVDATSQVRAQLWTLSGPATATLNFDATVSVTGGLGPNPAFRQNLVLYGRSSDGSGDGSISLIRAWGNADLQIPSTD